MIIILNVDNCQMHGWLIVHQPEQHPSIQGCTGHEHVYNITCMSTRIRLSLQAKLIDIKRFPHKIECKYNWLAMLIPATKDILLQCDNLNLTTYTPCIQFLQEHMKQCFQNPQKSLILKPYNAPQGRTLGGRRWTANRSAGKAI